MNAPLFKIMPLLNNFYLEQIGNIEISAKENDSINKSIETLSKSIKDPLRWIYIRYEDNDYPVLLKKSGEYDLMIRGPKPLEMKKAKTEKDLEYWKKKLSEILTMEKSLEDILYEGITKSLPIYSKQLLLKARGYAPGTIREWKGKKYKKMTSGKWVRTYDEAESRGAKQAIRNVKKKILDAKSMAELLEIVKENKSRFADKDGKALPIIKEFLEAARATEAGEKKQPESATDTEFKNQNLTTDLSNKDLAEIEKKQRPLRGGHWGSAGTYNNTAKAVAFTSSDSWKPIDKIEDGNLTPYNQKVNRKEVTLGIGLRKYAQKRLGEHNRSDVPSFFRGMTIDAEQWDLIGKGKIDTIELTGCTAFSCYENIADRYSSSKWAKSFGKGKQPIKIVLQRDDDVDSSVGMWHETSRSTKENPLPAFELLSGLDSVQIVSVEGYEEIKKKKLEIDKIEKRVSNAVLNSIKGHIEWYQENIQEAKDRLNEKPWYKDDPAELMRYEKNVSYYNDQIKEYTEKLKDFKEFKLSDKEKEMIRRIGSLDNWAQISHDVTKAQRDVKKNDSKVERYDKIINGRATYKQIPFSMDDTLEEYFIKSLGEEAIKKYNHKGVTDGFLKKTTLREWENIIDYSKLYTREGRYNPMRKSSPPTFENLIGVKKREVQAKPMTLICKAGRGDTILSDINSEDFGDKKE